jgi:type I restriction enzyme S subunit
MAGEWIETTVGEQATLQRGIDITRADQHAGMVPVVSSSGVSSYHDTPAATGPGVILGRKGVVGSVYYIPSDYWPHDTTLWVKDFHGNDPRFVYYFFRWLAPRIATMDVGSANPTLNRNHVHPIEVRWPARVDEQRAIAHILGTLDDKIELNRRMNETLEAMAQTLFKSWFVDFDPVRAMAEGRDTGLPKELADLFPDSFEESELGEIPKRWEVGRLGDLVRFLGGYAFKSRDWIEQGTPVVKIGSVKPGIVDLNEVSFVSREIAEEVHRYRLKPGDLLIGMTGYVGEVGLVPPTNNPPLLNQRVGKFVLEKDSTEMLGFIYCLTRRPEFKVAVEAKSHGTAQANVSAEGILSVSVIVPPKPIRDTFNWFCYPILDRILNNHGQSRTLAALRDALLPKLLSGELRVNDIKIPQISQNA